MRMIAGLLIFIAFTFTFVSTSVGAPACVNDPEGTKGLEDNQELNNAFRKADDPLTKEFLRFQKLGNCGPTDPAAKIAQQLSAFTKTQLPMGRIRMECIQASLNREAGNTGYVCSKSGPKSYNNAGSEVKCIDSNLAGFLHFSVNQAISCMSPPDDPIDPAVILKKFNNETGFNFSIAYGGGVGIGQLTSDPVKELAGWWQSEGFFSKKKKFIDGNASDIITSLMDSKNPACAPFKEIIEKDNAQPPPSPGYKRNYCSWVSVGDGLGRSLVYGLGYFVYARDHYIKSYLGKAAPNLVKNKELVNALTLVAYGSGGHSQAQAMIDTLRINNNSNPAQVIKKLTEQTPYLKATEKKMEELVKILKQQHPSSAADLRGDSCVSK